MRVGPTGPEIYLTGQRRKVPGDTCLDICVPLLVGWSLVPHTFPRMLCSLVFLPALFAALLCGVRAKNDEETATHVCAISHTSSARPPGRPDDRPD